jgi:hypothetical protein
MYRGKLVVLLAVLSFSVIALTGCGKMNAAMSAAVMLGAAAAGYGTYYYFYEYQQDDSNTAQLKVVNDSTNNLKVWVDNALIATVNAGTNQTFEVTPGSHALAAGVDSQTITSTQTINQGTVFTWTLTD